MSDERDTRAETLRVGDEVRYLHNWYVVNRVRQSSTLGIVLDVSREHMTRCLFYNEGVFVAARTLSAAVR